MQSPQAVSQVYVLWLAYSSEGTYFLLFIVRGEEKPRVSDSGLFFVLPLRRSCHAGTAKEKRSPMGPLRE